MTTQVLSIDSQIKEMIQLAEREGLEIVTMKRESHSAKETGLRSVICAEEVIYVWLMLKNPWTAEFFGSFLFKQIVKSLDRSLKIHN